MAERRAELERIIDNGLRAFVQVGEALREIRDNHLYRDEWDSFAEYCKAKWDLSRAYAYRLMDAAEIARVVSPNGDTGPRHESHARALVPLKHDEKRLVETWRVLREEHGDDLTAEIVTQAVRQQVPVSRRSDEPPPLAVIHVALDEPEARELADWLRWAVGAVGGANGAVQQTQKQLAEQLEAL